MDIQTNIKEILTELPSGVRLVAVSKFHPNECIEAAYQPDSASLEKARYRN